MTGNFKTPFLAVMGLMFLVASPTSVGAQSNTDWRKKLGVFRVGILAGNRPLLETRQTQPFRKALQKALGIPVEVFPAKSHKALVEALVSGRVEYAPLSATAFMAAWQSCKCVEPAALPRATDGSQAFRSIVVTKKNGPASLRALKGKTTIVPGKHSFAGFLYPEKVLGAQGIELGTAEWPILDEQTMEGAVKALIDGKGDAMLGWIPDLENLDSRPKRGTLHTLADAMELQPGDFKILWKSDPIPHGPHVIRTNLPGEAKGLIWKTLRDLQKSDPTAYDAIEPLFGGGFVAIETDAYKPLLKTFSTGLPNQTPVKKSP